MTDDPLAAQDMSKAVFIVHGQGKRLKEATKTLRPIVGRLEATDSLQIPSDTEYDLLLADYDGLTPEERLVLLDAFGDFKRRTRLLVVSEGDCKKDFPLLFGRRTLTNLLARNERVDAQELIVTVRKLLRHDIFGLAKYFAWGVDLRGTQFVASTAKQSVVSEIESFASALGVHPRLVSQFCGVADEFITNAVYNAPVDSQGASRFRHFSRSTPVTLEPSEQVEVRYCCDGQRLGLSVSDPFGSLTQDRLLDYLSKCFRRGPDQVDSKEGGAGLGFYYIFESLTQFVVNISPGKRTEMIGIMDVSGSFKNFASRSKSFNIFMGE